MGKGETLVRNGDLYDVDGILNLENQGGRQFYSYDFCQSFRSVHAFIVGGVRLIFSATICLGLAKTDPNSWS